MRITLFKSLKLIFFSIFRVKKILKNTALLENLGYRYPVFMVVCLMDITQ